MNQKVKNRIGFTSVAFGAILITFIFSQLTFINNLELKVRDLHFRLRGPLANIDTSIVIVGIDDQTFKSIPRRFPYPRNYYAKLIRNLSEAGARIIIFDIEFTEPYELDVNQDIELAQAAREAGNVIFAGKLVEDVARSGTVNRYLVDPVDPISKPDSLNPIPWGLVNIPEDADGFVRQYIFGISLNSILYYSLGTLTAKFLWNLTDSQINNSEDHFLMGDNKIPIVQGNSFYINYAGPNETFKHFSFVNILDDEEFDLGENDTDIFDLHKYVWGTFQNKIVFIGGTSPEFHDIKFVPFFDKHRDEQIMTGVEVHAHALNTLLTRQFLNTLSANIQLILIPILVLLVTVLVRWLKPLKGGIVTLFLILGAAVGTYYLFSSYSLMANTFTPIFAIVFSYLGNSAYLYITEQREKNRIRQTFQKYVSKSVVQEMLDSGSSPQYGGERKELTVLFSDIRSFTNFSEKLTPEEVVNKLSEYLTEMTEIVLQHNGTLDKFVGDEIMAIYGAPHYYENHAEQACRTAFKMIEKLNEMRQVYTSNNGADYFDIGVGVNTGDMVVGNLGSQQLFDYTVIGDAVNLGARLEGLNKYYGTRIIISEFTKQSVGNSIISRELDSVKVKGKDKPIRIFELIGIDKVPDIVMDLRVNLYNQALNYYYDKKWYNCLRDMNKILKEFPTDGPAKLYIRRCLDLMENPPTEEWEPVIKFETK